MGVRAVSLYLLSAVAAGCSFNVDYGGDGDAGPPDPADAAVTPPPPDAPLPPPVDAEPGTPDAAPLPDAPPPPPPDAGVPITVSFGERPGSMVSDVTFDTYLSSVEPSFNNGIDTNLYCSTFSDRTCLLRFDLSAIPVGAQVISASLEVWTGDDSSTGLAQAFVVTEAWDEGTVDEANGVSNWINRKPGVAWLGEGCSPPSRGVVAAGEVVPDSTATPFAFALDPVVVQTWVNAPGANFGLAIIPATDSNDFNLKAKDSSQLDRRPELTVTFVP